MAVNGQASPPTRQAQRTAVIWLTATALVTLLGLAVLLLVFAVFFSVPFGLGREGDFSESGGTLQ